MDISPDKYFSRMTEILQGKKAFLQDILVLTEAQSTVLAEDKLDELQLLIGEKQSKIDAINKLDEEFSVYFQRLKTGMKIKRLDELDAAKVPGARELKEVTGQILEIIGKIAEIEKINEEKGKQLLEELGSEIRKINLSKKAKSAYRHAPINIPSYFIDRKK